VNDTLLRNVTLPGGQVAAIAIARGRITAIETAEVNQPAARTVIDLAGALALPGLIDGHVHLDKTIWATGGTTTGRHPRSSRTSPPSAASAAPSRRSSSERRH